MREQYKKYLLIPFFYINFVAEAGVLPTELRLYPVNLTRIMPTKGASIYATSRSFVAFVTLYMNWLI